MVSILMIVLYTFFQMTVLGVNWMILAALFPSVALFLFLVVFFRRLNLHIRADEQALEFRFSPVQKEYQVIEWKFVDKVEIRQTSPIRRLAGWGILYGKTRVYSIGGHEGVELTFPNGLKLFLGSSRAQELERLVRTCRNKARRKEN